MVLIVVVVGGEYRLTHPQYHQGTTIDPYYWEGRVRKGWLHPRESWHKPVFSILKSNITLNFPKNLLRKHDHNVLWILERVARLI